MISKPSDNILELRRLSEKLCETTHPDYYKDIIDEIQKLVECGKAEVIQEKTTKEKIKCYENMCMNITKILQKIK